MPRGKGGKRYEIPLSPLDLQEVNAETVHPLPPAAGHICTYHRQKAPQISLCGAFCFVGGFYVSPSPATQPGMTLGEQAALRRPYKNAPPADRIPQDGLKEKMQFRVYLILPLTFGGRSPKNRKFRVCFRRYFADVHFDHFKLSSDRRNDLWNC